jgi:hypothetical protein
VDISWRAATEKDEGLSLPRPLRSGLAICAVGVLPLVLGLMAMIRPLSGIVLAGIFVVGGALQTSFSYYELVRLRRRADGELRREARPERRSSLARWRARQLTSDRNRKILARSLRGLKHDLSPGVLPGASPLNRVAARPHADLFAELAERLAALERPVTPQGVLEVEELLTSPDSPLYARERSDEIGSALRGCLQALENRSTPASRHDKTPVNRNCRSPLAGATSRPRTAILRATPSWLRRQAITHRRSQR